MRYTYEDLEVGMSASFSKTISEADVYSFAGITGDLNPAHVNEKYAEGTMFKHRIAHGMLTASLISTVLGTYLPGEGTIYMQQTASFLAPVYFGDTVTATVTVTEKIDAKKRVKLKTVCTNQDGKVIVDGEALILPPKA